MKKTSKQAQSTGLSRRRVESECSEWADLFDDWAASRVLHLRTPRSTRAFKQASEHVYREMWKAFGQFCKQRQLSPDTLSEADLEEYFRSRELVPKRSTSPLSARYAWRMLHLIDRVLRHHAERRETAANPAASALLRGSSYRYANCVDNDKPPVCLSSNEYRCLIAYLTTSGDGAHVEQGAWKQVRDRAAVSMMLGAGLTPGEMRGLALADIQPKLLSPAHLHLPVDRPIPLARWAAEVLLHWLRRRESLAITGTFVFPSTMSGKQWSHTGAQESCRRILARAGLPMSSGGLFRLRHTFALRHLRAGAPERSVAGWLGYLDEASIAQYRPLLDVDADGAPPGEQL